MFVGRSCLPSSRSVKRTDVRYTHVASPENRHVSFMKLPSLGRTRGIKTLQKFSGKRLRRAYVPRPPVGPPKESLHNISPLKPGPEPRPEPEPERRARIAAIYRSNMQRDTILADVVLFVLRLRWLVDGRLADRTTVVIVGQ